MAHGYYNLNGEFIVTNTKAEAVDAWRRERGYSTGGVYDMGGGEVIDTRGTGGSGPITPAIQEGDAGTGPPLVSGLVEAGEAYAGPQTYMGQLEALGINVQPGTPDPYAGMTQYFDEGKESGIEVVSHPGVAKNVKQIKQELSKQIGYDVESVQGGPYLTPQELAQQQVFGDADLAPGAITQGLFGGLLRVMSGMGGPTAAQYAKMAELQAQGMSLEDARTEAMATPPNVIPGEGSGRGAEPPDRADSYYGLGSKPVTLPKNSEGESYLPSAFLQLSEQIQQGHRSDMEIAESLAERLMTPPSLSPVSQNPPKNILLGIGDKPNDAFQRIQQIILAYLEQEAKSYPYDMDIQAIFAKFKNAGMEEFYALLGYGPTDANPNIWTRMDLTNENAQDVAASILSDGGGASGGFLYSNNNGGWGGWSGGGGGGSVSRSWGQASGGLYLWRIGA